MTSGVLQTDNEKKTLRETQTLRAGCNKAEPKTFAPPQTPFPWAQDGQNLIKFGENRCTRFRVIVVTDTARPPARRPPVTDRTDYNTLRR